MNALVLVDLQEDFMPGGPLGVPGADTIGPRVAPLLGRFELVVATMDWHPPDHGSFAVSHPGREPGDVIQLDGLDQILWPVHCVARTPGAELVPALAGSRIHERIHKGVERDIDSYSGFFDNGRRRATGLEGLLRERGVRRVTLCGVATDYCVRFTALDAARLGFETRLLLDLCRGVGLQPGDVDRAVEEMRAAGVVIGESGMPEV